MRIGKRGAIEDGLFWMFRLAMIFGVAVLLVFFVNSAMEHQLDTKDLELYLISARMINSPSCLALEKSIDVFENENFNAKRVYPGVVDLNKYNAEYLNKSCLVDVSPFDVGIKLALNGTLPVYINKDYYDDIEPLTFSTKYYKVKKVFVVSTVDKEGKTETKTLEVVVVAKKK